MKLHLINLISFGLRSEWGYWGYQRCDKPDDIRSYVSEAEISQVKEIIKNKNNKIILYATEGESWSSDAILSILSQLEVTPDLAHVRLIVDSNAIDWRPDNILDFPVVYYKRTPVRVANYEDLNEINTEVNLDKNRFLYLMGKPYKGYRIGLLYKLYKANLLKSCDWSFIMHDGIYDKTRECLNWVSDQEFEEFVQNTTRTLDDINVFFGRSRDRFGYDGMPFDRSLYTSTSFSLISETMIKPNCLTEKTWRTISNRHPFVTLGNDEIFTWMNSVRLDTFDYVRSTDSSVGILDQAIASVKIMLNSISDYKNEVKDSIEKNYETYRNIVSKERVLVDSCLEKYLTQPFSVRPNIIDAVYGKDAVTAINKLWC